MENNKRAVVLLSGGLDSSTTLAIANSQGYDCFALSFNYDQSNVAELDAAKRIARQLQVHSHRIFKIDLGQFGGSALTDHDIEVPIDSKDEIPLTYVPARNTVFLSLALSWAEVLQANNIFIGVNAVDYSGYPDCRSEYIKAFGQMANLATKSAVEGNHLRIHTPLIELTKSEIVQWGTRLGLDYSQTISCYQADQDGRACGLCDACKFRRQGFKDASLDDPTSYQ